MRSFETIGALPALSLPSIIEERVNQTFPTQPAPTMPKDKDGRKRKGEGRSHETSENRPSPAINTEVVVGWRIPQGKPFSNFFGKAHRENTDGFPQVLPHHNPAKKGLFRPCLSWHLDGQCGKKGKCFASHVPASSMPAEAKRQINEKLAQVYAS